MWLPEPARATGAATAERMMRMACSSCAARSGTKAKGTASGATGDFEAQFYGDAYQGLISDALAAMFGDTTALARHNGGNTNAALSLGNL